MKWCICISNSETDATLWKWNNKSQMPLTWCILKRDLPKKIPVWQWMTRDVSLSVPLPSVQCVLMTTWMSCYDSYKLIRLNTCWLVMPSYQWEGLPFDTTSLLIATQHVGSISDPGSVRHCTPVFLQTSRKLRCILPLLWFFFPSSPSHSFEC